MGLCKLIRKHWLADAGRDHQPAGTPEGADMRIFCFIGLHDWHMEDWSGRVCHRCDHREILIYTSADGAVWERVT